MSETDLPYRIMDADNHFNEPPDCYERYIDPHQRHLAIRYVKDSHGQSMQLFAGRPSKFTGDQIVFSADTLKEMLGTDPSEEDNPVETPGIFLNRLNSLKGLSETEKKSCSSNSASSENRTEIVSFASPS